MTLSKYRVSVMFVEIVVGKELMTDFPDAGDQ